MRLESIELVRFGEYIEHPAIDGFGPGLNVICADNEAGKSTLLAALRFGLFGSAVESHRVGEGNRTVALRLWRNDQSWQLRRVDVQGGGAYSLKSIDGSQVVRIGEFREDWLGGKSLATYQSVYALSLDELVWQKDLRDLILLAEAGSLGVQLRAVERNLGQMADGLYSVAGSKRELNAAVSRWQDANSAVRVLGQQPRRLDDLRLRLAEMDRTIARLAEEQSTTRRDLRQRRDLLEAWPAWNQLAAQRRRLDELAHVADYPPTVVDTFRTARQQVDAAQKQADHQQEVLRAAGSAIERLVVDEPLLGQEVQIERQRDRALQLAQWPTQLADAERLARQEREVAEADAKQTGGEGVTAVALASLNSSATVRGDLDGHQQALLAARQLLQSNTEQTRRTQQELATAEEQRERALVAQKALPEPLDAKLLDERRRVFEQRQEGHALWQQVCAQRDGRRQRLAELRAQRQREDEATRQAAAAKQENEERLRQAQGATGQQHQGGRVALLLIAVVLLAFGVYALVQRQGAAGGVSLVTGGATLLIAMLRVAGSVVLPNIQLQMPALVTVTDEALAQAQAELDDLEQQVRAIETEQANLSLRVGLPAAASVADWRDARARLDDDRLRRGTSIEIQQRSAEQVETCQRRFEACSQAHLAAGQALAASQDQLAAAQSAWSEWLVAQRLPVELSCETARIWLETAARVQQRMISAKQADQTAAARREELEVFRQQTDALGQQLQRRRADDDPWGLEAAKTWAASLVAARGVAQQRTELAQKITVAESAQAQARAAEQDSQQTMAAALARAGATDEDDLLRLAQLAAECRDTRQAAIALEAGLRGARDDGAWASWQQALSAAEPTVLPDEVADLEARDRQLGQDLQQVRDEAAVARQDAARLENEADLAQALLDREQADAQVAQLAATWSVHRVAQALLDLTWRRHEAERQPERVARIGDLFRQLTDGRWENVVVRDGALVAIRAGGTIERTPETLSRGAREALFLCARLAALEHELERAPLPVALDDTLVNLDRDRRRKMLTLVGKLAEQTQVLVFTCHEFMLRELAEAGCACNEVALPTQIGGGAAV